MTSVSDLLERIEKLERANKDKDLEMKLLEARVEKLETAVELKSNTIKLLQEHVALIQHKANRTEQYTMRPQLRIHGVPAPDGKETNADVMAIVHNISEDLGVAIKEDDIFRAHRVGKVYNEKKRDGTTTSKKLQSIIVRFRSWEKRCEFYRARPKKGKQQPRKKGKGKKAEFQSIGLDLSKATRDLVDKAKAKIEAMFPDQEDDSNCYAFADINCNPCIKLPGYDKKFVYFTNEKELDKIIADL